MLIILVLQRWRQKEEEFKVTISFVVSLRQPGFCETVLKHKKEGEGGREEERHTHRKTDRDPERNRKINNKNLATE